MILPYPIARVANGSAQFRNAIDDAVYPDHATAAEATHAMMYEIDRRLGERRIVEDYRAVLPAYRALLQQDAAEQGAQQ